jgi:hypothetical protein
MERTSEGRTRRHHLNAAKPENHTAPRPSRGVTMELKAFRGAFHDHFRMPNAVHAPMRVCVMRKYREPDKLDAGVISHEPNRKTEGRWGLILLTMALATESS